jgi:hypothetical protein
MPFGLQLVGRLRGDAALLSAARSLEQAFAASVRWCRPRPDIAALRTARPELKSIVTDPPGQGDEPTAREGRTGV